MTMTRQCLWSCYHGKATVRFHLMLTQCRTTDQANQLGCESTNSPDTTTIIVYYYYYYITSPCGLRLSQLRYCSRGVQSMPMLYVTVAVVINTTVSARLWSHPGISHSGVRHGNGTTRSLWPAYKKWNTELRWQAFKADLHVILHTAHNKTALL